MREQTTRRCEVNASRQKDMEGAWRSTPASFQAQLCTEGLREALRQAMLPQQAPHRGRARCCTDALLPRLSAVAQPIGPKHCIASTQLIL